MPDFDSNHIVYPIKYHTKEPKKIRSKEETAEVGWILKDTLLLPEPTVWLFRVNYLVFVQMVNSHWLSIQVPTENPVFFLLDIR